MRTLLAALCLAACSPASPPSEQAAPHAAEPAARADLRGEWRLAMMNGRGPDENTTPITLSVGDFSLRAQSQCIAFWHRYEQGGDRLVVSRLNPGAMCARGLTQWETEFGKTLSSVDTAALTEGKLRLAGGSGELVFDPAPLLPRERFTGRWRLRFVHGAAPPAGEPPLEITVTDDRITTSACVFSGWRYRQDGRLLEVTPLAEPVCERAVSPFEQRFDAFMTALNRATLIQGEALILDSPTEQWEFRRVG